MIKIIIVKKEKLISSMNISGHSNYAEYGKDIICSAISGIVQGMFNAILKMCNNNNISIKLEPKEKIQGSIIVKDMNDKVVQLLLKAMYYQLYTVKVQFPKYIKIENKEVFV